MTNTVPNKKIFIEDLEEMFSNIAANTDWNMSGPMLWGHFFTHSDPARLEEPFNEPGCLAAPVTAMSGSISSIMRILLTVLVFAAILAVGTPVLFFGLLILAGPH